MLTYTGLDTLTVAYINFFVLELLGGVPVKKNTLYEEKEKFWHLPGVKSVMVLGFVVCFLHQL